ncbi:Mu transposase C-terminal domain-containing protein [Pseudomonas sp. PI1]|uniref:Mu transposase C-terminal domain-containing protein n=1 Tax=Pseudomonas sp. PI1 TaxID=1582493 RepID=UPI0009E5EFE0|nr:Mu transposase C-terminal domain-containing protein [Pseudomonas sp. PI1]
MLKEELRPGLVVIARGTAATVVHCLPDLKVQVITNLQRETLIVGVDELEILPVRSEENIGAISSSLVARAETADAEEIEAAKNRFKVISQYLEKSISRKQAVQELGVSNSMFYKLLRLCEGESGYLSLLRMKRGRPDGVKLLGERMEDIISKAINEKYQGKAATFTVVWREVERLCLKEGIPVPSQKTVTARIKSLDARELHRLKFGAESASQKFDARSGKLITTAPLEFAQMDHTLVDVIVVDDVYRKPLGRPWLTVIIDKHTRVILGYYLSLHHPSTLSVACAITHAALPKRKFLERMNLPDTVYPFYGIPKIIHMDNAKEFKSAKLQRACAIHKIEPKWRPYGAKHYGGHVERLIGTLMTDYVHFLPGSTYSNVVQRRGYNSEEKAALSFKEFCRWFAGEVAVYHGRRHRELGCSPRKAWARHFGENPTGIRHPELISKPWEFRLDFMPEESRVVQPQGVAFNGKWYWSPALVPHIRRGKVTVKYDPFSMGTIWVKLNGEYLSLHFADATSTDFSYEEYRNSLLADRISGNSKAPRLEDLSLVNVMAGNDNIIKESVKKTKAVRKKEAAKKEYLESSSLGIDSMPKRDIRIMEKPDYSKRAVPFSRKK